MGLKWVNISFTYHLKIINKIFSKANNCPKPKNQQNNNNNKAKKTNRTKTKHTQIIHLKSNVIDVLATPYQPAFEW